MKTDSNVSYLRNSTTRSNRIDEYPAWTLLSAYNLLCFIQQKFDTHFIHANKNPHGYW